MKSKRLLLVMAALLVSTSALAATVVQEAKSLIASGDAGIALVQLDNYLVGSPKDAEARFVRGMALSRLNRNQEAMRAFSDLIRDMPQYPEPYNNLGVLLAGAGEYAKARVAFETALQKNPQYASARKNLADVEVALAMQTYQAVLAKNPGDTAAQAKLAMLKSMYGGPAAPDTIPKATGVAVAQEATLKPTPVASALPVASNNGGKRGGATAKVVPVLPVTATPGAKATLPVGVLPSPARPAPEPAPATVNLAPLSGGVIAAVNAWAHAWVKQDAGKYLKLYAPDFQPQGEGSRDQWLAERRQTLTAPKQIRLRLDDLQIKMLDEQRARVTFREIYESDLSSSNAQKAIELQNTEGGWLIVTERTI